MNKWLKVADMIQSVAAPIPTLDLSTGNSYLELCGLMETIASWCANRDIDWRYSFIKENLLSQHLY